MATPKPPPGFERNVRVSHSHFIESIDFDAFCFCKGGHDRGPGFAAKRHFPLPSPEASPEGTYVGQHSQGIGGHYQQSHLQKRQRLSSNRARGRPF
jgi:hypothetical protein